MDTFSSSLSIGSLVRPKVIKSVHYCPATKKTIERKYSDLTSLDPFPTSGVYPTKVNIKYSTAAQNNYQGKKWDCILEIFTPIFRTRMGIHLRRSSVSLSIVTTRLSASKRCQRRLQQDSCLALLMSSLMMTLLTSARYSMAYRTYSNGTYDTI